MRKIGLLIALLIVLAILTKLSTIQAVNLSMPQPRLPISNPVKLNCTSEDTTGLGVDSPLCRSVEYIATGGFIDSLSIRIFQDVSGSIWDYSELTISVELYDHYGSLLSSGSGTVFIPWWNNSAIVDVNLLSSVGEVDVGEINIVVNCQNLYFCFWFWCFVVPC